MKKILALLAFTAVLFTSCEGDPGSPGPSGEPGVNILGQTFEIENINYSYDASANLWSTIIDIPSDIEVFESDAILVYRFDGQVGLNDGSTADLWSLIPQNFFTDEGTIQYVSAHTFIDVELFIDGNYDLSNLDFGYTDDQIFRFVVVPSDFALTVDVTDYNAVMNALNDRNNTTEGLEN
jgi:hypothetical protein